MAANIRQIDPFCCSRQGGWTYYMYTLIDFVNFNIVTKKVYIYLFFLKKKKIEKVFIKIKGTDLSM